MTKRLIGKTCFAIVCDDDGRDIVSIGHRGQIIRMKRSDAADMARLLVRAVEASTASLVTENAQGHLQ